jgi:hypothetical protein
MLDYIGCFVNAHDFFSTYTELETKRILLEIFKERQRKSAEAGSIPSFYKKVTIQFHQWAKAIIYIFFTLVKSICSVT